MIYHAIDIAEYIINFCNQHNNAISNLQLQKILYYVQGYSLALRKQEAFHEEIVVWQYGPVVPKVYEKFSVYAGMPIQNYYDVEVSDQELERLIQLVALDKMRIPVWKLVEETHKEAPWKYTKRVFGNGSVIPKKYIKQFFEEMCK